MVFGPKFPREKICRLRKDAMQPEHFEFDSFGDEEGHTSQLIEKMLDFLDLDNPPTPENIIELASDELEEAGPQHPQVFDRMALDDDNLQEIRPSADMGFHSNLSPTLPPLSEAEMDLYHIRLVTRDSTRPREDQSGSGNTFPWDEELPFDAMSRPIKVAIDFQLPTSSVVSSTFVEEAGEIGDTCFKSSFSSASQSDPTAFCPSDSDEIVDARFSSSTASTLISPFSSTESLSSSSLSSSLQTTFTTTVKAFQWLYPPFDVVDRVSKSPSP